MENNFTVVPERLYRVKVVRGGINNIKECSEEELGIHEDVKTYKHTSHGGMGWATPGEGIPMDIEYYICRGSSLPDLEKSLESKSAI
jgi:hypothetical protein